MARKTSYVTVRARVSFNGIRQGDEATVVRDTRVSGWIDAGLMEEVSNGTGQAGPGGAEPGDDERKPKRAAGSVPAGGEQGEGFGAGGYGSPAQFDQS